MKNAAIPREREVTISVEIDIDMPAVPFDVERDGASGQFMVCNDEIQVAAMGNDEAEAVANFRSAVAALVENEAASGRAVPEALAQYIRQPEVHSPAQLTTFGGG